MSKRFLLIPIAVATLAASSAGTPAFSAAKVSASTVTLHATLLGKNEAPPPGDPKGRGTATVQLSVSKQTVCFSIKVLFVKPTITAAHIHSGHAGKAGPIVVMFTPPVHGSSSGCVHNVRASLIKGIENHPSSYYVNVHSTVYPGGAVRGQLG